MCVSKKGAGDVSDTEGVARRRGGCGVGKTARATERKH